MCGIIGAFHTGENKEPVNEAILNQFEDQQHRGTKGFGIIKIHDKMSYQVDRATEGYKFMWDIHHNPVRCMIVHHRTPTSSDNKMAQTHPIVVDNGSLKFKYLFVHNGVIYNEDEVRKTHEGLGFVYTTIDKSTTIEQFNDSEVLAIEIARFIEKQTDIIASRGSAAFMCLQIDKKTDKINKLFFGRNTNPLHMAKTRNIMLLSSEGKGDDIEPMFLYECHLDDKMKLSKRKMEFAKDPVTTYSSFPAIGDHSRAPARSGVRQYKDGKWSDYNSQYDDDGYDGSLTTISKAAEYDDDDPNEELSEIVEGADQLIQTHLDSFYDMLYEPTTAETIIETDVDVILEQIKVELEDVVRDIKEKHMAKALEMEAEVATAREKGAI